jgi:hypothetical protein
MNDEHINNLKVFCEDLLQNKPKRIVFEKMLIELMIERSKINPEDNILIDKINKVIESIEVMISMIDSFKIEE